MTRRSGRGGTGARPYRRNRDVMLVADDICALCGHGGARTADHIIPKPLWPRDADGRLEPGFDGPGNLQPAHGTMGSGRDREHNPCPVCGRLCNQSKGARGPRRSRSQNWFPDGLPRA